MMVRPGIFVHASLPPPLGVPRSPLRAAPTPITNTAQATLLKSLLTHHPPVSHRRHEYALQSCPLPPPGPRLGCPQSRLPVKVAGGAACHLGTTSLSQPTRAKASQGAKGGAASGVEVGGGGRSTARRKPALSLWRNRKETPPSVLTPRHLVS